MFICKNIYTFAQCINSDEYENRQFRSIRRNLVKQIFNNWEYLMIKSAFIQSQRLPYESPYVERMSLPEGNNILVSFSLELDFEDFEEEDEF